MALIFMDGFDHYGSSAAGRAAMLDGVYAEVSAGADGPSNVQVRTGTLSMRIAASSSVVRRILGSAKTGKVGQGAVFFKESLPTLNARAGLFDWRDNANTLQVSVVVQTTGAIAAYRGRADTGVLLGQSADGVFVASAFQHVEAAVLISDTVGTVEVRINGVTVLSLTGQDTRAGLAESSQVSIGTGFGSGLGGVLHADDYFCWDDAGTENNDFLGDRRVRTLFPNGNTASAGWTAVGAASGYLCIDEAAPNDETDYLEATGGTTPTSEFDFEDLPAVGAVSAVQTYVRMRKTNAGTANAQVSLVSGASVDAGTDRAITEVYTYYADVSELDPATGVPWTQSSVNSAKLRIARTV